MSAPQPQQQYKPEVEQLPRGSLVPCNCARVVRNPYRLLALRLRRLDEGSRPALELRTLAPDGTIKVWHRDHEVIACGSR